MEIPGITILKAGASGNADAGAEDIGGGIKVFVSEGYTFGTDALLLADFSAPKKSDSACDLCSGCGIIPLLWLRERGALKKAYAVDIQPQAYEQMKKSAAESCLEGLFTPLLADLRTLDGYLSPGTFTLITCNPPYNAANTGALSKTDSDRIARHETMCTINDVCSSAGRLLKFGGRLCVCQLPERLVDVLSAMRKNNIEPKRLRFVQKKADAAPWLVLIEGKLGAKPFLKVESPFLTMENGEASPGMKKLYGAYGRADANPTGKDCQK